MSVTPVLAGLAQRCVANRSAARGSLGLLSWSRAVLASLGPLTLVIVVSAAKLLKRRGRTPPVSGRCSMRPWRFHHSMTCMGMSVSWAASADEMHSEPAATEGSEDQAWWWPSNPGEVEHRYRVLCLPWRSAGSEILSASRWLRSAENPCWMAQATACAREVAPTLRYAERM